MKIINKIFLLTIVFFTLLSCRKDELSPVGSVVKEVSLTSPSGNANYILTTATAQQTIFTLIWKSADFGYDTAISYSLELDKASGNFSNPQIFNLGTFAEFSNLTYEKTIKVIELNSMLLGSGGSIDISGSFKIRVVGTPSKQQVGAYNGLKTISAVFTFTATPYDTFGAFSRVFVAGNYGAASTYADWSGQDDGTSNSARLYSPTNGTNDYEGFVWMNVAAPEFKFTNPGWSNHKGKGATAGVLESPGSNILLSEGAGTYYITCKWNDNAYTVSKKQIAIIGAASGGWSNPLYMDFVTDSASPYYRMYTKNVTMVADEFLIRLNDDWSNKFGGITTTISDLELNAQNKIKLGGSNMKITTPGNYKVVLDIRNSANYNLRLIPL